METSLRWPNERLVVFRHQSCHTRLESSLRQEVEVTRHDQKGTGKVSRTLLNWEQPNTCHTAHQTARVSDEIRIGKTV